MLARQGQPTLSLQEALAGAAGQPVAVQPLLLLPGRAYEEIKSEVQAQRHCFPKIRLGKPLVSAQEDLRALAAALNRAYPAVAGETLVLVGHGTDHKAGAAYVRLQAMFHAGGRGDIRVVTLKERLEKKALFSELKAVAPAVHLVPLLLAAGKTRADGYSGRRARKLGRPPTRRRAERTLHTARPRNAAGNTKFICSAFSKYAGNPKPF